MLARKVLDLAEEQGLLDGNAILELRRKLEETKFIVTPEAIAKVLVDHGHLTPYQARKLVAQALGPEEPPARPTPGVKRVVPPKKKLPETVEMTLADEEQPPAEPAPTEEEVVDLELAEPEPMPVHRGRAWKTDPLTEPADDGLVPLEPLAGLTPLAPGGGSQPAEPLSPLWVKPIPRAAATRNVWDSPLLLIGGGVLGVVLVAFAVLLFALTRGSAAEMLKQADEAYRSGAYTSAIAGYERFLKRYPNNPEASKARVFCGMARIRQVSDDGKNPRLALQAARDVLPQIEREEQFSLARPELSTILPDIADGFATQAGETEETAQKEALAKLAGEAMELVNNPSYLPSSLRREREQRIAAILDKLRVVQRSIDQDREVGVSIERMEAATASGKAADAYRERARLLRTYPALEAHPRLLAATRRVGEKERELVEVSQLQTPASKDDPLAGREALVIVHRQGPPGEGSSPKPGFVLLEGAAYGLDVATGRVLWRRYVGYQCTAAPVAAARDGSIDALVTDGVRNELLRLRGETGEVLWRQAIGEAFFAPVIAGQRVILTTWSGRVMQLDSSEGTIVRAAQLPQRASVAAAYDPRHERVLQLGEHSTLFVLAADTLACTETMYLGHKRGAMFVPPAALLDYILVCESPSDDSSLIRALATDVSSKRLVQVGRPFRLKGRVVTPLAASGRRVCAMTDLGQIAVLEADSASEQEPVRLVASVEASETAPLAPYYALEGNRLWTATRRRTLLEVQSALQQLTRRWSEDQGDVFLAPLQLHGDRLLYARRDEGHAAVLVEACKADTGAKLWTTQVAAPIAALAASPAKGTVEILTAEGRLFSVPATEPRHAIVEKPSYVPPTDAAETLLPDACVSRDGGTLVWTERAAGGRIYSFDLGTGGSPTATALPAGSQAAAAAQKMGGGLLVPLSKGSVVLLEPSTGKPIAQPFLPPLVPDALPRWTPPAVLADGRSFLISDGRGAVYAVILKDQPQPHLALVGETRTAAPIVSPLVAAGGTVFGLMRSRSGDSVAGFDEKGAAVFEPVAISGRAYSGPIAVGGMILVAGEPDGLLCLDGGGKTRWQQPPAHGRLAGAAASADGELLLVYQSGVIARVDAARGKELATADIGQPLGQATCLMGVELFVAGSDGTLHRTSIPARP